ncbi:hypothetical protein HW555_000454, partial [Spodoptera exigua]
GMSALLQVPRSTLERHMNMDREILNQDFVPRNVGINHISRAEDCMGEKLGRWLHYRHFGALPCNNLRCRHNEFSEESSTLRQYFEPGDVFILDRGFRDSLPLLERCGYQVHVPLSPEDGESQLSTRDANKASTHLMTDFAVAAALINKFHTKIRDRDDAAQILEIVHQNMETNNDLSDYEMPCANISAWNKFDAMVKKINPKEALKQGLSGNFKCILTTKCCLESKQTVLGIAPRSGGVIIG